MGAVLKKIIFSAVLAGLAVWLLIYSWQGKQATLSLFDHTVEAADHLGIFPTAQYEIGYQFWFQNRADDAVKLFKRTLYQDMYHIDAWLKMGEIEFTRENRDRAKEILLFVEQLTSNVFRWKWKEAMLARDLAMKEIFIKNINYLIPFGGNRQNSLFVLDQEFENNTEAVLNVLAPGNELFYLNWLMQWRRVDDAQILWNAVGDTMPKTPETMSRYIHFLLSNHRIKAAKSTWGKLGMTNPAFENELAQSGFGWRTRNPKKGKWMIKRKLVLNVKSDYILQVMFAGNENISFHHIYQIIPVEPKMSYQLTYEWRSRNLTTDQRPFVEIYGHQCKDLYAKGKMIAAQSEWHEGSLEFSVPETCEAVVLRLRRLPSKRFDSKIGGKMWLNNFSLKTRDVRTEGKSKNLSVVSVSSND